MGHIRTPKRETIFRLLDVSNLVPKFKEGIKQYIDLSENKLHHRNKMITYLREEHTKRGEEIKELKKQICDITGTCEFFKSKN